ncbi:MAG: hypothetical protein IID41_10290 [Planctomycetes bacterium]|nr:hypothetical protein [Planctomycetota bacterium]
MYNINLLRTGKWKAVEAALVEGASIDSTVRVTGVSKPTILKLLRDLGTASALYHDRHVRGLRPKDIQSAEICSFNYCNEKNIETATSASSRAESV